MNEDGATQVHFVQPVAAEEDTGEGVSSLHGTCLRVHLHMQQRQTDAAQTHDAALPDGPVRNGAPTSAGTEPVEPAADRGTCCHFSAGASGERASDEEAGVMAGGGVGWPV